jgi:hypothetical protein
VTRLCAQCGASKPSDGTKSLYKCTGCKSEYYCSKACQAEGELFRVGICIANGSAGASCALCT